MNFVFILVLKYLVSFCTNFKNYKHLNVFYKKLQAENCQ